MPGSTGGVVRETLERTSGKRVGRDFGLCYNPEFIALGSVIRDFLNPDFLLIGQSDPRSGDILETFYRDVCENQPGVARMNFVNAEIAKFSVNGLLTTKISFANMLARVCEALPDADVDVVSGALGLDTRIGIKISKGRWDMAARVFRAIIGHWWRSRGNWGRPRILPRSPTVSIARR